MGIKIRAGTVDDAEAVAVVQVEGWQTAYRGIVSEQFLDNLSGTDLARIMNWRRGLERDDPGYCFFVAEDTTIKKVVGFACSGKQRDNALPDYDCELYALYILSTYRGQAIGRQLVTTTINYLQKQHYQKMLIWVLRDNPYREFYERIGGDYITEKIITIDDSDLMEVAYGWHLSSITESDLTG